MSTSSIRTPLTDADIVRIAKHLKIPINRFIQYFVVLTHGACHYEHAPSAMAHIKTDGPCPFLRQGLCGINDVKPKACSEEVPMPLDDKISCAEWHKSRIGWLEGLG